MVNDAITPDARLPELLAARAHAASARRLRLDVLGGLLGAALAVALRPRGWFVFVGAGLCFATFGGWGLVDRALARHAPLDHSAARRLLTTARAVLAVTGTLAAATVLFGGLVVALGTWIS